MSTHKSGVQGHLRYVIKPKHFKRLHLWTEKEIFSTPSFPSSQLLQEQWSRVIVFVSKVWRYTLINYALGIPPIKSLVNRLSFLLRIRRAEMGNLRNWSFSENSFSVVLFLKSFEELRLKKFWKRNRRKWPGEGTSEKSSSLCFSIHPKKAKINK